MLPARLSEVRVALDRPHCELEGGRVPVHASAFGRVREREARLYYQPNGFRVLRSSYWNTLLFPLMLTAGLGWLAPLWLG